MSPDAIREAIQTIRKLTHKPFAVNLFIPESQPITLSALDMTAAVQSVNQASTDIDVMTKAVEPPFAENFEAQIQVVIDEKVPVFSFTFGLLAAYWRDKLKENNCVVMGTATSVKEAEMLAATGENR